MVLEILNFKKDGFYVDIGANDGITFSNTKVMGDYRWGGIVLSRIVKCSKSCSKTERVSM